MVSSVREIRIFAVFVCLLMSAAAGRAQSAAPPAIQVTFGPTTVTASGITPRGRALFFAIGRQPKRYWSAQLQWTETVSDTAGTGSVTFDAKTPIPTNSIWAVVDPDARQFVIATPDGRTPRLIEPEKVHLARGRSGAVEQFVVTTPAVLMLYVTPSGDSWIWTDTDGSIPAADYNGYDISVHVAAAKRFNTPANDKPGQLGELASGGVIVFFDVVNMRVYATRLDDAAVRGAR